MPAAMGARQQSSALRGGSQGWGQSGNNPTGVNDVPRYDFPMSSLSNDPNDPVFWGGQYWNDKGNIGQNSAPGQALGGRNRTADNSGTGVPELPDTPERGRMANPDPLNANTPVNPMQSEAYDRTRQYGDELASGTNQEITRELSRARDEISVGMRAEGEGAMGRGADPTLFRQRALASGARNISNLQGRLADVALGRRAEANRDLTSAAGAAASEQRLMHLGTISAGLEGQRVANSTAETQARLQQAPYDRLMSMMDAVARNRDAYGGITSGSAFLSGGGPSTGSGGLFRRRLGHS